VEYVAEIEEMEKWKIFREYLPERRLTFLSVSVTSKEAKYLLEYFLQIKLSLYRPRQR
jgi:hypothetical protein